MFKSFIFTGPLKPAAPLFCRVGSTVLLLVLLFSRPIMQNVAGRPSEQEFCQGAPALSKETGFHVMNVLDQLV